MAWAKIHTDLLSDPKLMRAIREGHRGLILVPWFVVFAKRADDGGRLSVGANAADPEDIATTIPDDLATADFVAAGLASCLAIGVLVREADGVCRFGKWDSRQSKPSDSNEAWRERKQRQRAHQKASTNKTRHTPVTREVTGESRGTNTGDVTPCPAIEKRNPTGFLGTSGVIPVRPAAADAARRARDIVALTPEPELAEPTAEERARARTLAAELRAVETS